MGNSKSVQREEVAGGRLHTWVFCPREISSRKDMGRKRCQWLECY